MTRAIAFAVSAPLSADLVWICQYVNRITFVRLGGSYVRRPLSRVAVPVPVPRLPLFSAAPVPVLWLCRARAVIVL